MHNDICMNSRRGSREFECFCHSISFRANESDQVRAVHSQPSPIHSHQPLRLGEMDVFGRPRAMTSCVTILTQWDWRAEGILDLSHLPPLPGVDSYQISLVRVHTCGVGVEISLSGIGRL